MVWEGMVRVFGVSLPKIKSMEFAEMGNQAQIGHPQLQPACIISNESMRI